MVGRLNAIHHQDCIAGMAALDAGSIDLAFADPPFNIGYEYDVYEDSKERDHYLTWSKHWIEAVHRILKPTGAFWLAIGDEYAAELKLISQDAGFHCRSWVVWYYTFGVNCTQKFTRSHVHLFYFVRDPRHFTFRGDDPENRIPSARQLVYADSRANPKGRFPDDTWILRPQDATDSFTPLENTWYLPRIAGTFRERAGFHGCQMPEQLLGRVIRFCSEPGEVVLDPFSGSAVTLAVAKKLGRRYIGFDLSKEYVERGCERLDSVCVGDALDGSPEPIASAPQTPASGGRGKRVSADSAVGISDPVKRRAEKLFVDGLVASFDEVRNGFSLDRVVADPYINLELAHACRRRGLPGEPITWNKALFCLRKAGELTGHATWNRTELSWARCDRFLFASEIALQRMLSVGHESLDDILCDPVSAREFDVLAERLAPGFNSLEYRWAALKLRKEAKSSRSRASNLPSGSPLPRRFTSPFAIDELNSPRIPERAGVYVVCGSCLKQTLYVGECLDLRRRLTQKFAEESQRLEWTAYSQELSVKLAVAETDAPTLLAYQSLLVAKLRPQLNLQDLAAV